MSSTVEASSHDPLAPRGFLQQGSQQRGIERLAAVLVAAGRVAPALEPAGPGGQDLVARCWPLPAPQDRPWLEALLPDDDPTSQRLLAESLATAVDRLVRQRLRRSAAAVASAVASSLPARDGAGWSAEAWLTDLAGLIEQTELCALSEEQATLYQAVAEELLEQAEQSEGIARQGLVLAGLTRLKQVCNHPAHYLDDGSELEGRSGKLSRCEQLLAAILEAGERALIFTQYTAWGDRLARHLARRIGEPVLWLHGGLSRAQREELVAR
ncbi:MAG: DEAD/DEAH box helicase [Synechococcaceae cyanobacterium]|nr:DEAD/DEAH box helicase [Synechococcaceae cyanobacterium]